MANDLPLTWIPINSLECNIYYIVALSRYVVVIRNPKMNHLTRTYVAIRMSGFVKLVKDLIVGNKIS